MFNYQLDPSSGIRLIGGDMLEWSDLNPVGADGVGELGVLPQTLSTIIAAGEGKTLLIGPRASMLASAFRAGTDLDIIVRSLPDARALSAEAQLRGGMTVWCGGFERMQRDGQYDLVILLDGPSRVLSPDSPGMTDLELLSAARELVAPQGRLVCQIENGMGVDRILDLPLERRRDIGVEAEDLADLPNVERKALLRLERAVGENADDKWWHGATGFADRPPYLVEARSVLNDLGFEDLQLYSVFPTGDHPTVLVAKDGTDRDLARAQVARAQTDLFTHRAALSDPLTMVRQIFDSGMELQLAPGWFVIAGPAPKNAPSELLWSDLNISEEWRNTIAERRIDGEAELVSLRHGEMIDGRLRRNYQMATQRPPRGDLLELALRDALASENFTRIRTVMKQYVAWLTGSDLDKPSRLFATPENVIVSASGELALLDATWEWLSDIDENVLVIRNLRHFAKRVLRARGRHPWRPEISADHLTETLGVLSGVDVSEAQLRAAAALDVDVQRALGTINELDRNAAIEAEVATGSSQFSATGGPARGYRESVEQLTRMSNDLDVRQGQIDWLESALRMRERRIEDSERLLKHVRGSVSFKIGRALTLPGRRAAAVVQSGAERLLPQQGGGRKNRS